MIFRQLSSVRRISLSLRVVSKKSDFRTIRGGAFSKLQQNDEERHQIQEYLALEAESRSQFKPISEEDEERDLAPTEKDQGYGYGFNLFYSRRPTYHLTLNNFMKPFKESFIQKCFQNQLNI